jgi:hypothetical protein
MDQIYCTILLVRSRSQSRIRRWLYTTVLLLPQPKQKQHKQKINDCKLVAFIVSLLVQFVNNLLLSIFTA